MPFNFDETAKPFRLREEPSPLWWRQYLNEGIDQRLRARREEPDVNPRGFFIGLMLAVPISLALLALLIWGVLP
jgi:hypothetical protein